MDLNEYMRQNYGITLKREDLPVVAQLIKRELILNKKETLIALKKRLDFLLDIDIAKKSKKVMYTDARELFIHFSTENGYTLVNVEFSTILETT